MVTVSSPLDPIVNCVILVLSFPWTYLEKKKNHRMSREVHMKHNIASCPLFEGIEKHIWMVCFCKMKCLPTNLFTVLHKKSITSLAFGWHKMNSKTFKYHFSAFRRNVIVPVLFSGSSIENTFHIFSMETLCPGGFLEIRNTLKTEEKVGDLF